MSNFDFYKFMNEKMEKRPFIAVDGVVYRHGKIVLIERLFPPLGYALPGGFVEFGESTENAVIREVKEETGLDTLIHTVLSKPLGVLSDPERDPRTHIITVVYMLELIDKNQKPVASDDAKKIIEVDLEEAEELIKTGKIAKGHVENFQFLFSKERYSNLVWTKK